MPGAKPHTTYDDHTEAQELRRMLREKQRENERLQKALRKIRDASPDSRSGAAIRSICDKTLTSGGDDHATN